MSLHTRSQKMAKSAYSQIAARTSDATKPPDKEYATFARKFPSLIHTCGLAQAVAFAEAKKHVEYLDDLAKVLKSSSHASIRTRTELASESRTVSLSGYLRLSRDSLIAASWLKRYVDAVDCHSNQDLAVDETTGE